MAPTGFSVGAFCKNMGKIEKLFGYEGKNVVITGAGSGMGLAATKLLVAIGSDIFSYMSGQVIYIDYGTASLWEVGELTKDRQ